MTALSAAVVAAIEDLELAARLVVEGMRAGGHRSPFHGFSTEFRQHRPYRAGDDLKYLDWKVYARSDRLYTRQFRETTNLSVMLVLDTSASMGYPANDVSKFRYSQIITAALAYLAIDQGHAVGLMATAGERAVYLPARGGRPHLRALLARLDDLAPAGPWEPARAIARGAQLLRRRGVVVAISDFYDDEEGVRRELRRAAHRGHDVTMLQVLSPGELRLPYERAVELEDLESGVRRLVDGRAVADAYNARVAAFLDRCRAGGLRDGIDYTLLSTDTPPASALRNYLLVRGNQTSRRTASAGRT